MRSGMSGRKLLRLLVSALMVAGLMISPVGTASAATQTLMIYGANGTPGTTEPYTDFSTDGGATWQPAYLSGSHPWGFVPGTNSWLNCNPNGQSAACVDRTVMYRIRVTVPNGATNPQLDFDVNADNYATIYVNGTHVMDMTGGSGVVEHATITGSIHTGINEIRLDVRDTGGWAGINYKITLQVDSAWAPVLGVPTVATSGNPASVKAGAATAVVVDPGVTLHGFDMIDGAAVAIGDGFVPAEDQLSFVNQSGITGIYNSATGVLTLSGTASSDAYQAALRTVRFRNTQSTSTALGDRTITFTVGAGTLFNPATDHFYQFIVSPGISWTAARDAAANRSLYGLGGYLATITSAAENSFVTAKLQGTGWIGASDAAQEGVWKWVTGPEAGTLISYQFKLNGTTCSATTAPGVNGQYVNWHSGEPNDCGSYPPGNHAEDYAHYYTDGTWNDFPNTAGVTGYVVEYGGMAGDAQPVLSADATVTVIDGAPPNITGAPTTAPNANNWYNSNVTVHFTCTDVSSGVATCGPDQTVSQEGANRSVTGTATDNAGNTASATVAGINLDKTAPVTTISAPGTWHNQDVPVTLGATDSLSGVAAIYHTLDGGAPLTGATFTISAEGVHTIAYWSVDKAGNIETARTATVQIDRTAPVTTAAVNGPLGPNGWYQGPVTVALSAADPLSGVQLTWYAVDGGMAEPGTSVTLSADGQHAVVYNSLDNVGNREPERTVWLKIDATAPTITGSPDRPANGAGWYNAPVTVSFTCADATSGVATCSAPVTLSGEGAGQSAAGTATDMAGNSAGATVSDINIDMSAPQTAISAPTAWQNQDVPVTLTATDNLSGVAGTYYTVNGGAQEAGTSFTLSAEGTYTISYWSVDAAGNAEASHTATIQIDKTNPTISGAPDRAANGAGWYDADVTVSFTCADALSGVAACSPAQTLGEGAEQSVTGTAVDDAGNTASATVSGINVDKTAPTISGAPDRSANSAGWYKANVTVSFTCADALSGVASCSPAQTLGEGANQSATGDAADKAGNTASATVSGINVDKTAPTISAAPDRDPNGAGWYDADVTVGFTCADALSGVAACSPAQTLGEGAHQSATGTVTDNAGNTASATVSGINVDKTAPTINGAPDRAANGAGWYKADVTVSFTCGDALSGIAACSGPQTLGEGADQSVTGDAADKAGNTASATVSGINVDKTAPSISGAPDRDANAAGWYNSDVTVSFTCADALSGVAACSPAQTLGEGAHQSATGSVADSAGNTASATVSGINIDKTAPTVTYTGNAGTYSVDQKVVIKCTATDSLSGVASSDCADIVGPAYDFELGVNTFTATAIDKAGNETTVTVSFTVTASNASLCSLTKQFVKDKGLANSLCVKLQNAAKQAAAGNAEASRNMLGAYINEVAAQTEKALTADQAAILTRLAEVLID